MSDSLSIMDSPLWINGASGHPWIDPKFIEGFNLFLHIDRFGGPFLVSNDLALDKWYFAFDTEGELPVASPVANTAPAVPAADEAAPERPRPFPYLCAVPFTVTRSMCNDSGEEGDDKDEPLHMCTAAISLLTDMITSFHTYLALHPNDNGHVSVSIQTNQCRPLRMGEQYVAVARIDKMGRRIVFANVDYMELNLAPAHADAVRSAGLLGTSGEATTIAQLKRVLPYCTVLANAKHVKSILSAAAQKRVASTHSEAKEQKEAAVIHEKTKPTAEC